MATRPNCGEFLDAAHQCGGRWHRRWRVAGAVVFGGLVGGAVGIVVLLMTGGVSWVPSTCAILIGMAVMPAIQRGEPPLST